MQRLSFGTTCASALFLGACALPSTKLPSRNETYVAVLSGEMPGSLRELGRHSWIVANVSGALHHRRYQWLGKAEAHDTDNVFEYFGNGEVAIHGVVTGTPKEMAAIVACLEKETASYDDANCGCWPGPSSNTFIDGLIRKCGLGVELPPTALGRDYRGPIGVSTTEAGTGVQLETWVGGVKLGLKEGVVANLVELPLGVRFWPPAVVVPLGSGYVGVDTSTHHPPDPTIPNDFAWPKTVSSPHHRGAASLAMALAYGRVATPNEAAGLSDRTTVGLRGNAVYGKTIGYAFGFDVALGASAPFGFAYTAHLLPAGVGVVLGDTGFVGAFAGVGTSGASSTVPAALELPTELRFEVAIARAARLGLRGGAVIVPDATGRNTIETVFGATTRLGTRAAGKDEFMIGSGGFFLGLERREIMNSFFLGASFGYELGAGG